MRDRDPIPWATVLRNTAFGVVVLGLVWVALHVELPSSDEMRDVLESWGGLAWLAFIVLYALVGITPIPVTIMSVTGGILFGVLGGTLLSVIGAILGSWAAYWIARLLGRSAVRSMLGRHAVTVERHLETSSVEAVYLLRLMPGLPYWPLNYGAGAFGVTQRDFLVGSSVATIPGQLSLVAIGSFIATPNWGHAIMIGIAWIVVLTMTFFAYRRLRQARQERQAPEHEPLDG